MEIDVFILLIRFAWASNSPQRFLTALRGDRRNAILGAQTADTIFNLRMHIDAVIFTEPLLILLISIFILLIMYG